MAMETGSTDGMRHLQETITIRRTPTELFAAWRNLGQLPVFLQHVESIEVQDARRSRWTVAAPAGQTVSWEAVIDDEIEGELLTWHSVPGSGIDNHGAIRFAPAPRGRGTEVSVSMDYGPPAGSTGASVAKLFGEEPSQQLHDDLHRFKQLMETGRIITSHGQSTGER